MQKLELRIHGLKKNVLYKLTPQLMTSLQMIEFQSQV